MENPSMMERLQVAAPQTTSFLPKPIHIIYIGFASLKLQKGLLKCRSSGAALWLLEIW